MTASTQELRPNLLGHSNDFSSVSSRHVPEWAWIRGIGLRKREHEVYYSPTEQGELTELPDGRGHPSQALSAEGPSLYSRNIAPPTSPSPDTSGILPNDLLLVSDKNIRLSWLEQHVHPESTSTPLPEGSPKVQDGILNNAPGRPQSPEYLFTKTPSSLPSGSVHINHHYPSSLFHQHKKISNLAPTPEPNRSAPETINLSQLIQSWATTKDTGADTEKRNLARQERFQARRNYANRTGRHRVLTTGAPNEASTDRVRKSQQYMAEQKDMVRLLGVKLGLISERNPSAQHEQPFRTALPQAGRNHYISHNPYILRPPSLEWTALTRATPHEEPTTLRHVIFKSLFFPSHLVSRVCEDMRRQAQCPRLHKARCLGLDEPLSAQEVQSAAIALPEINYSFVQGGSGIGLALCSVCQLPKILETDVGHSRSLREILQRRQISCVLPEFNPNLGIGKCCSSLICNTCIATSLLESIYEWWWVGLSIIYPSSWPGWMRCPACKHPLSHDYKSSLTVDESLRVLLGDDLARPHLGAFSRAQELRNALNSFRPALTSTEVIRCQNLHESLVICGNGKSFFADLNTDGPAATPLQIQVVAAKSLDGQTIDNIPIFTNFLKTRDRDCIVCAETYREFDPIRAPTWAIHPLDLEFVSRLPGAFPTRWQLSECHHEQAICHTCLTTHITIQVESRGRACIENIKCPHPDCSHVLTYEELRLLASPDTFKAYDRHLALSLVSGLPDFRWCLRPGCTAGGLYDMDSSITLCNKIACDECDFDMCYRHQTPWHEGLTCSEFDSLKEHGDPQYAETQRWLGNNTKPCPGPRCGAPIVKGEGCFHMTCSVSTCKHEFCWECLADWNGIFDRRGQYRIEGHNPGCYFRGTGLMPTQIVGRTVRAALRMQ